MVHLTAFTPIVTPSSISESSSNGLSALEDFRYTRDTVMVGFSGLTMLVWDHIITFDDEVEFIWKRDKGLVAFLFLLNRYLTPLGFVVNLVAFTLPSWSFQHFVRYEGSMTVIGIQVAGILMFLRVRALYKRNLAIIWSVVLLFFVWFGLNAWLLTHGVAVSHPSGVHSCTMIFDASLSDIASASAWFPLLYDTYVFALTLYKTKRGTGHVVRTLLADGILYYSVLCVVNVVLTIMIVRAGPGIKNIAAQLELLLTVAMVSRITLNLRKQALGANVVVIPSERELPRTMCWRSKSDGTAKYRPRSSSTASTAPRRSSITFRNEPVSYPEHIPLNPIYSVLNLTPEAGVTPVLASPVGEEARFQRLGV